MDSPETFIAFGAVMLVIALLGVAIDWFGKPLRHRRFVPKMYRFPEERQPKRSKVRQTPWSDTSFVLPVVDQPEGQLVRYPDPHAVRAWDEAADQQEPPAELVAADPGPPTMQVAVVDTDSLDLGPDDQATPHIVTLEDHLGADAPDLLPIDAQGDMPSDSERGWEPGDDVFNVTDSGSDPPPATVHTRFWQNVALTTGAAMFGADNVERMQAGQSPTRRNPRSGKLESMQLPGATHDLAKGTTPVPAWPEPELDPFT